MNQNPQPISPVPPTPPPVSQQPPQKPNNKKTIIIILVVVFGSILLIVGILAVMIVVSLGGARGKAQDAAIKGSMSTLPASVEVYFDKNRTYVGWNADQTVQNAVQKNGSEVKVQGLSTNSYVIYVQLPTSKKIFCLDASGFQNEITSIKPTQTTCR